jgi:putative transcriptional regulator
MGNDREIDFFKIEHQNLVPTSGTILISEPFSNDAYFKRSVILLTMNDEEGAVGFILNKNVNIPLFDIFGEDFGMDASISIGGPVSIDRIDYLHTLGNKIPDSTHILGNIYWGGNFEVILQLMRLNKIKKEQIRFFLGYSGWGKGQLKNEIDRNYWLVSNADEKTIMTQDDDYWRNTLQRMGKNYSPWLNIPEDPQLN